MHRGERGAAGLFIAVLLILIVGGILSLLAFLQSKGKGERSGQDTERFEKIKSALVQFVAANGRLPCPANPALPATDPNIGNELPTAVTGVCDFPLGTVLGTVPWQTLGIRRDDSLDSAGWQISYRVYPGNAGSLTQVGGASMVDCEPAIPTTAELIPAGRTPVTGVTGGLCRTQHDTTDEQFLAGKGLAINYFGTAVTDAAYVLISHGPSGLGAWTYNGTQTPPLPTSANELTNVTNMNAAVPLVAMARSAASVGPSDAAHFDDVLVYQTVKDVVRLAGRGARDWPELVTLNRATLEEALGTTISGTNTNLGVSSLLIRGTRVTGLASGGASNLSYFMESGGVDGIGGASGGGRFNSAQSEGIRLEFNQTATKLGLTLNHFGIVTASGNTFVERAQLVFYDAAGAVVSTINVNACRPELSSGTVASYSVSPAGPFSRVDITPQVVTGSPAGTRNTTLILSEFVACNSTTCLTSLYDAVNNSCP